MAELSSYSGRMVAVLGLAKSGLAAAHALIRSGATVWAWDDDQAKRRDAELSNIAIILAFVVGAELAGVVGALIALPIAAAYPAIERIWLRDKLGDQVVHEHRAIQRHAK